jgi:hypothetical protein
MTEITQGLAASVVLTGVAVGLAGPASAELVNGTYTAVIGNTATTTQTWAFTPCGQNCMGLSIGEGAPIREMHLQGNTWSAVPFGDNGMCSTTIDNTSLAGETGCGGMTLHVQLSKA